ncbi:MAG: processing peptidase [Bacteroidetes bacterium]|jgi:predicted Zn-dependent peptidase|nr:processing peptidase [Bacteroidota bacterium]
MKKIFASITAIIITATMLAQEKVKPAAKLDRSKRPVAGPAPTIKLGNIQSFQLPNGLKVFVVENHKAPTVAYSIILNVHPSLEGDAAGLANITSQLITSGTKNRSKDQLDNDIDFIGATLSASPTSLYAASLKKQNNKLLELMSDVILNPDFKQEELDKLKTQTLSGLEQEKDDPDAISKNVKAVLNFGQKHPYGENATVESVGKISLDKCNNYYSTYFRPNVAYMAIVGDVTLAEIKPLIEKYFGSWKTAEVPNPTYAMPAAPSKTRVAVVNKPGAVQSVINVTYPVDLKPNSDDVIKAKVLNTILGAGFSSRLFMNLREKRGYTYGSYSSLNNDELVGEFSAYAKVRNAVTDSSVAEIMYELNRLRTEKVPQDELDGIKNFLNGSFAISLEDPETVARFAINIERYKLPKDYYENYLKNLAAVTSDDVFAMAQKYIRPDNATILVVGDQESISKSLERFSPSKSVEMYDFNGNPVTKTALKPVPAGVTPKTVIDSYTKALGGEKAVLAVKDVKLKYNTEIQGRAMTLETMHKAPNKYAMSFNMGAMTLQKQTYDGAKGKQSGLEGKKELTGEELDEIKAEAIMNPEMQYEKMGHKLNLKGIEAVNGSDAYILEVVSPSGKKSTEWYDVASGLKVRSSSTISAQGQTMTQVTEFGDYKDFSGVKYPGSVSITGSPMPLKLKLESAEVNKGISDSAFTE